MARSQVEVENLTTGKMLNCTAQLFDRHYYSGEALGEIITDGLKTIKKMLGRVNTIAKTDPDCLPWVENVPLAQVLAELEQFKQLKLRSQEGSEGAIIPLWKSGAVSAPQAIELTESEDRPCLNN